MNKEFKINDNYGIVCKEIKKETSKPVVIPNTNHIFVVDVSGSMSSDLPLIRTQLKNKLSNIMRDGDTISILWFSGRNEAGILKEEVEVKSLKTLSDLNDAIDKWLKPICLTAFLKPLELVGDLIERVKKNRPNSIFSMIFLTDGYNNDCPWNEVVNALKKIENQIISSTFVEYGYYADSKRLTEMASIMGGEKISCTGFDEFEPVFDNKISTSLKSTKKIMVDIPQEYMFDFAFSFNDDSILLYNIVDSQIMIGDDVDKIYYFSHKVETNYTLPNSVLYAATYVLADKLKYDEAETILRVMGDGFYYNQLQNSYGKQKLNKFKSDIKEAIFDVSKQLPTGYSSNITEINENTYCLMNLIDDITNIKDCKFYKNHEAFNYHRIGRKMINLASILSEDEKSRLVNAKSVKEANEILNSINENKVELVFIESDKNVGYPVTDLVWNNDRANLSVRICMDGFVELPDNKFGVDKVNTFKYKTYTIIKDGIVNIQKLPLSNSEELVNLLLKHDVKYTADTANNVIVVDLTSVPIINKSMVNSISAKDLANKEWELIKLQGFKKVYDYFRKDLYPKESKSLIDKYGEECATWLGELGITDYNGFNPKMTSGESNDFYMSVVLETKIKGLSSLPKVEVVLDSMKANKPLKISEIHMADAIKQYQHQLDSEIYKMLPEEQQKEMLKTYLITKTNILNTQKKNLMQKISEIKFGLILSKRWFKEFNSLDENKLTLNLDNRDVDFTFNFTEKEEKI